MITSKISVIVPIHNSEKFLVKCLNSITNQTYQNLEIILVDNGSTDNCGMICDQYAEADSRIIVIRKTEGNVASSRNIGLKAATGEYIGWVDSDDWIEPDMFEYLFGQSQLFCADIAVCGWYTHQNGETDVHQWKQTKDLCAAEALEELLKDDLLKNHLWNKLWRSELFHDIRFPDCQYYEDIKTVYRLFLNAERIVCLPELKYHYSCNSGSLIQNKSLGAELEYCITVKRRFDDISPRFPKFIEMMEIQILHSAMKVWSIYYENTSTDRETCRNRMREISVFEKRHLPLTLKTVDLGRIDRMLAHTTVSVSRVALAAAWALNRIRALRWGKKW